MVAFTGSVTAAASIGVSPRSNSNISENSVIRANVRPLQTSWVDIITEIQEQEILQPPFVDGHTYTSRGMPSSTTYATRMGDGRDNNFNAPSWPVGIGYDWFERMHSTVLNIDLGSFVSDSIPITIYSAYRDETQSLSSIPLTTGAGSFIEDAPTLPYTHPPQKSITVNFVVTGEGPASIDGNITFVYPYESLIIPVLGTRIVVFSFIPEDGIEETLEWKTDILKSVTQEQRIALRAAPRSTRKYTFYLHSSMRMQFEQIASNRNPSTTAPAWWDARIIRNIASGDSIVKVNINLSEFDEGGLVLFVNTVTGVSEVQSILALRTEDDYGEDQGLELSVPLLHDYDYGYAVPSLVGAITSASLKIHNQDHYIANLDIACNSIQYKDMDSYDWYWEEISEFIDYVDDDTFYGYVYTDIMYTRSVLNSPIPVTLLREGTVISNGIGPIAFFSDENRPRTQEKFTWVLNDLYERSRLKQWLWRRYGRQKAFMYSSHQNDIEVSEYDTTPEGWTDELKVVPTGLKAPFFLHFVLDEGYSTPSEYYEEVTSIITGDDYDTLIIPEYTWYTGDKNDVIKISMVRKMRHSSDSITLKYTSHNVTTASTNCIEV